MSCGVIEYGKCDVCGKEGALYSTYFHYPIKCECHAPQHFEIVRHCANCEPKEPLETKIRLKTDALKKLAQYEDLEEQGLLVRLPCKVGDKIWYIERDEDGDAIDVSGVMFLSVAGDSVIGTAYINDYTNIAKILQYHIQNTREDYGTSLFVLPLTDCFITREEAEAALRKMESSSPAGQG